MWDRWADWVNPRRRSAIEKRAYGEDEPWYSRWSRKAWGGLGAGAGLIAGAYDKMTGQSQGSWGDYVRTGYHVGHDNADRMAGGMAEGATYLVPDFSDGKVLGVPVPGLEHVGKKINNAKGLINDATEYAYSTDNTGYRDLGEDVLSDMWRDTNYAGMAAGMLLTTPAVAKGFSAAQKGLTSAGRAGWNAAMNPHVSTLARLSGAGAAAGSAAGTAHLWGLDNPAMFIQFGKDVKDIYSDISNPSRARSTGVGTWTGATLGALYGKRGVIPGALAGAGYGYLRDISPDEDISSDE